MASSNKIEDIIDSIEAYIDECKPVVFSTSNIQVNKDELESLLTELRTNTPEVIRQYQRMVRNYENIIAEANARADDIINKAQIQTNELVSEHQIMQQAYAQANEVIQIAQKTAQEKIDRATEDANNIRMGAIEYTDQLLANIQSILSNSIETARNRNDTFLATMQAYLDTVEQNRVALSPSPDIAQPTHAENAVVPANVETEAAQTGEDDVPALDIPEQFFNKD